MLLTFFYLIAISILTTLATLGLLADYEGFVGSLFAAFLSVFVVVFIEMELRPRIRIVPEPSTPVLPDGSRFLRVIVTNQRLWWPLNLVMDRRPAYLTRAWITFLTETNELVFAQSRRMVGRWSNTPEPVRPISLIPNPSQPNTGTMTILRDLSITRDAIDIPSGAGEPLDIVMRRSSEDGCRGWCNAIIDNPNPRPEDQFELAQGRYRALVQVETSGRSISALFRIVCDVGIIDFRLEPIRRLPRQS